jgi:hypothetical protein
MAGQTGCLSTARASCPQPPPSLLGTHRAKAVAMNHQPTPLADGFRSWLAARDQDYALVWVTAGSR